jgi:hypothetical protein
VKSANRHIGNARKSVLCSGRWDWLYVPLPRMVAAE